MLELALFLRRWLLAAIRSVWKSSDFHFVRTEVVVA